MINNTTKLSSYLFAEQVEQQAPMSPSSVDRAIKAGQFTTSDGRPVAINSFVALKQHAKPVRPDVYVLDLHAAGVDLSKWHMHKYGDTSAATFQAYLPYCAQQKPVNPLFPKVLWVGKPDWPNQDFGLAFIEPLKLYKMTELLHRAFDASYRSDLGFGVVGADDPGAYFTSLIGAALRTVLNHRPKSDTPAEARLRAAFNIFVKELGVNMSQFVEFLRVLKGMGAGTDGEVIIDYDTMTWRENDELVMLAPIGEYPWDPSYWY